MLKLIGNTLDELKQICAEMGLPSYAAKQIADWIYKKKVRQIDQMTNISKAFREKLSEKYEVGRVAYADVVISSNGKKKYLFPHLFFHPFEFRVLQTFHGKIIFLLDFYNICECFKRQIFG